MTKAEIMVRIESMEKDLKQAQEDLVGMKSPAADAMRATVPMMKDMLAILKAVVEVV